MLGARVRRLEARRALRFDYPRRLVQAPRRCPAPAPRPACPCGRPRLAIEVEYVGGEWNL
jgi:hypothetical protein